MKNEMGITEWKTEGVYGQARLKSTATQTNGLSANNECQRIHISQKIGRRMHEV